MAPFQLPLQGKPAVRSVKENDSQQQVTFCRLANMQQEGHDGP